MAGRVSDVIVVGNGPSLQKAGKGALIDSHEPVIRLKKYDHFYKPGDYGTKCDYIAASAETARIMLSNPHKPKEYWIYPKCFGTWSEARLGCFESYVVIGEYTEPWNEVFRQMVNYIGAGPKGRNFSIGLAAAITAMERFKPEELWLAGFDTVLHPEVPYVSMYNPHTRADVHHLWEYENKLLYQVAEKNGTKLCEL